MTSFQLQKLQLSEQQQQQQQAQLQKQFANQQLQQRVAEQQLQQSVADRQLQQNLLQVQKQLQKSNQQPIPLQQLSFEYSNGKDKIFAESFQSSIFGTLVFQINFLASRGLVQKNFPSKQFLQNSLGDAEEELTKNHPSFYKSSFPEETFTKTAFQTAA